MNLPSLKSLVLLLTTFALARADIVNQIPDTLDDFLEQVQDDTLPRFNWSMAATSEDATSTKNTQTFLDLPSPEPTTSSTPPFLPFPLISLFSLPTAGTVAPATSSIDYVPSLWLSFPSTEAISSTGIPSTTSPESTTASDATTAPEPTTVPDPTTAPEPTTVPDPTTTPVPTTMAPEPTSALPLVTFTSSSDNLTSVYIVAPSIGTVSVSQSVSPLATLTVTMTGDRTITVSPQTVIVGGTQTDAPINPDTTPSGNEPVATPTTFQVPTILLPPSDTTDQVATNVDPVSTQMPGTSGEAVAPSFIVSALSSGIIVVPPLFTTESVLLPTAVTPTPDTTISAMNTAADTATIVANTATGIATSATQVANTVATAANTVTTATWNGVTTAANTVTTATWNGVTTAANTVTTATWNGVTTAANTVTTAANTVTTAANTATTAANTATTAANTVTTAADTVKTAADTATTAVNTATTSATTVNAATEQSAVLHSTEQTDIRHSSTAPMVSAEPVTSVAVLPSTPGSSAVATSEPISTEFHDTVTGTTEQTAVTPTASKELSSESDTTATTVVPISTGSTTETDEPTSKFPVLTVSESQDNTVTPIAATTSTDLAPSVVTSVQQAPGTTEVLTSQITDATAAETQPVETGISTAYGAGSSVTTTTPSDTTNWLPDGLITATASPTLKPSTSYSGNDVSSYIASTTTVLPQVIAPAVAPTNTAGMVEMQVGFKYPLNYPFVASNPLAAAQIAEYLPRGVAYGLNLDSSKVELKYLVPYAMSDYDATVVRFYLLKKSARDFVSAISDPSSDMFNNPNPTIATLMNLIDTSIPTTPEDSTNTNDGSSNSGSGSNSSPTSGPTNGWIGSLDQSVQPSMTTSRASGKTAGISVGTVGGAVAVGSVVAIVLAHKRRKRRAQLSDTESEITGSSDDASAYSYDPFDSYRLSQTSSISDILPAPARGPLPISQPVMSENSLGWL